MTANQDRKVIWVDKNTDLSEIIKMMENKTPFTLRATREGINIIKMEYTKIQGEIHKSINSRFNGVSLIFDPYYQKKLEQCKRLQHLLFFFKDEQFMFDSEMNHKRLTWKEKALNWLRGIK